MGVKVWTVGWSQGRNQAEGNTGDFAQLMASGEEYLSPQVSSSERTEQEIIGREYDGGMWAEYLGQRCCSREPLWRLTKNKTELRCPNYSTHLQEKLEIDSS